MRIITPKVFIPKSIFEFPFIDKLGRYARVCYKSEDAPISNEELLRKIIKRGHESILEHEKLTMLWLCDRGVTHEFVRHRIASFSQESTRYVDYMESGIGVIDPIGFTPEQYAVWKRTDEYSEQGYLELRELGASPQLARRVLPTDTKTEIIATMNVRQCRHFFDLRSAAGAHPDMQRCAIPTLRLLQSSPNTELFFKDVPYNKKFPEDLYAQIVLTDDGFNAPAA